MSSWSCNIEKKGRILRGVMGTLALAGGVYLLLTSDQDFWATGLMTLGGFAVFEAIKGWCAIRALGFRTPI